MVLKKHFSLLVETETKEMSYWKYVILESDETLTNVSNIIKYLISSVYIARTSSALYWFQDCFKISIGNFWFYSFQISPKILDLLTYYIRFCIYFNIFIKVI